MNELLKKILEKNNTVVREIRYGGKSREQVIADLSAAGIGLNEHAKTLLGCEYFRTSAEVKKAKIVELSVEDLELETAATLGAILERGQAIGLGLCPLEMGPYYRLQYADQVEEIELQRNKAPKGSITILSEIYRVEEDDFPKGFYIRKIEGQNWLRGYVCSMDYVWEDTSRLAFCIPADVM